MLLLALGAVTIPLGLAVAVLALLLFAFRRLLAHGLGQHPRIMLRVLGKIFCGNAVMRQLRVAVQLIVFVDDLLRGAAHLTVWARAIENPVYNIYARGPVTVLIAP
jgi:hypothetical protein